MLLLCSYSRYEEIRDFLKEGGHSCCYNGSPLKLVLKIAWSTCSETVSNTQYMVARLLLHRCTGVTVTPVHRYTGTRLHRYTVTPVHRYTGTPLHRYTVTPVHRYTGTPLRRYAVMPLHRYSTPLHRYTATPVHCYTVTPVHRYTATPVHRYTGTPVRDFLSDAGFLNLENFQPLARFKVRKLLATLKKADDDYIEWPGRALQASAAMFIPTEEHVDVTH